MIWEHLLLTVRNSLICDLEAYLSDSDTDLTFFVSIIYNYNAYNYILVEHDPSAVRYTLQTLLVKMVHVQCVYNQLVVMLWQILDSPVNNVIILPFLNYQPACIFLQMKWNSAQWNHSTSCVYLIISMRWH